MSKSETSYLEAVRAFLVPVLSRGTWTENLALHDRVELVRRPDLQDGRGKDKYVAAVLTSLPDDALLELAKRCVTQLADRCPRGLQHALWWIEAGGVTTITAVTRNALADALEGHRMSPRVEPAEFLKQFSDPDRWQLPPVEYDPSDRLMYEDLGPLKGIIGSPFSASQLSELRLPRRTNRKLSRYSHRQLFACFGFNEWPDKAIFSFLEAMVHPTVREGDGQAKFVARLSKIIEADGWRLAEAERMSGRPVFRVQRARSGVEGRPKNLIFASTGPKPELGFVDAINNDVVILKHSEDCLLYEDPLGDHGLSWDELVRWWARQEGEVPDLGDDAVRRAAGKSLADRLVASLGSEPEKNLFNDYFRQFLERLGAKLPALLPQVYLHYDPVTVRELRARGEERRFLVQRMDFLLLLPHRVRVVIEVDGQQHYSEGKLPSPRVYAETTRSDRDLRLLGYEVYRFGGHELHTPERAAGAVGEFFERLFWRHRLAA